MTIFRPFVLKSVDIFFDTLSRLKYKNFNWFTEWDITEKCNLKCRYCFRPHVKKEARHYNEDYQKSLKTILKLKPKGMIITGGEPLMVESFPSLLEKLKKELDPRIIITTNLSVSENRIKSIMPYVSNYHVSLDGLGKVNEGLRGYSGDLIINNMRFLWNNIKDYHENPSMMTLTVLTRENCREEHIVPMLEAIKSIDAGLLASFAVMLPVTDSLSVASDNTLLEETRELLHELKSRYNIITVGSINRLSDKKETEMTAVKCYRQFFRSRIKPDGSIVNCKPSVNIPYFKSQFLEALSRKDFSGIYKVLKRIYKTMLRDPGNPLCLQPCKCEEFIDTFLLQKELDMENRKIFRIMLNSLAEKEKEESFRYITEKINKEFKRELLDW